MALIPRKPHYPLPSLEEKRWKSQVGEFGPDLADYLRRLLQRMGASYDDIYKAFLRSWYPKYSTANVSDPPSEAELNTEFGSPAIVGAGFTAIVNDAGGESTEWLVWSDGTYWWYVEGTKAV